MTRESPRAPSLEDLLALVAALEAENAALKARLAELERRLGLNSSNSGKPPSSDGLTKPARARSLRDRSGKKPGGQKGHKGETLRQVAEPDVVVNHYPSACSGCGAGLDQDTSVGHAPGRCSICPTRGPSSSPSIVRTIAAAPIAARKRGRRFRKASTRRAVRPADRCVCTLSLALPVVARERLVELMADLLGVTLAASTIARISRDFARRFQGFANVVRDHIAAAPVKHMDESGFRIGGKTRWLHVACMALLTFYHVRTKRGSLLANVAGIVVHDHWKPYYTMPGVLHALCNAHHVRELKALVEIEKEEWARKMQRLLRRACHAANLARERGGPPKPSLIALIERRYDAVVAEGLAFHTAQAPLARSVTGGRKPRGRAPRRTGHNLLLRLAARKQDTLRFLHDPAVPFTNNQAERDGRMMKLRQKISGGFRSIEGAMDFALIRSFLSTAKKQGWAIIDALTGDPTSLANSLRLF